MPKETKPPQPPTAPRGRKAKPSARAKATGKPRTTRPPKPKGGKRAAMTHDAFFKRLLSDPQKALAFLRCFPPPRIAERLADRPPRRLPAEHVAGRFSPSQSDLLYRAFLKDGSFVDVNLEHKSAPSAKALAQMYGYYLQILVRSTKEAVESLQGNPAVINLLAYHGRMRWNPVVTLQGTRADAAEAGRNHLTLDDFRNFRILFIDIRGHTIDNLTDDPELQAALYAMAQDSPAAYGQILERLTAKSQTEADVHAYIGANWHTGTRLLRAEWDKFNRNQDRGEWPMQTILGRAWEEGREEGMELGIVQGGARWLIPLLRRQFGSVPKWAQSRVKQASAEELDAWFSRLPKAPTLEAVFEGSL